MKLILRLYILLQKSIYVLYWNYIFNFRKEGGTCPIDSQKLSIENDIFPDNYTKREISQQIVTCPFPDCSKALPLLDAEKHMFDEHHDVCTLYLYLKKVIFSVNFCS